MSQFLVFYGYVLCLAIQINGVPRNSDKFTPNYALRRVGLYYIVENKCGMGAMYHIKRPTVKVWIPTVFGDGAFGLCGNCNHTQDDYRLRNGTDVSAYADKYSLIGNSYWVPQPDEPEME